MWLPILIIGCAVALLLGPILLMQPSAYQRRLAALRQCAAGLGLRVHLQPPPPGADTSGELKTAAMYCLPWQQQKDARNVWVLVRKGYPHDLHAFGHWDWQGSAGAVPAEPLVQLLQDIPEQVFAVASGPQGLCCYWSERGDESQVRRLAQWLKEAAGALTKGAEAKSAADA